MNDEFISARMAKRRNPDWPSLGRWCRKVANWVAIDEVAREIGIAPKSKWDVRRPIETRYPELIRLKVRSHHYHSSLVEAYVQSCTEALGANRPLTVVSVEKTGIPVIKEERSQDQQLLDALEHLEQFYRESDRYWNATAMAKAYSEAMGVDKRPQYWLDSKQAKLLIESVATKAGIPALELTQIAKGGSSPGTWIHPLLVHAFAQWLSPDFYVLVSHHLDRLHHDSKPEPQQTAIATASPVADTFMTTMVRHLCDAIDECGTKIAANAEQINRLATRLDNLESKLTSTLEGQPVSLRIRCTALINRYAERYKVPHAELWETAYFQFKQRCGFDAVRRAANDKFNRRKIQIVEDEDRMFEFFSLCYSLFSTDRVEQDPNED